MKQDKCINFHISYVFLYLFVGFLENDDYDKGGVEYLSKVILLQLYCYSFPDFLYPPQTIYFEKVIHHVTKPYVQTVPVQSKRRAS